MLIALADGKTAVAVFRVGDEFRVEVRSRGPEGARGPRCVSIPECSLALIFPTTRASAKADPPAFQKRSGLMPWLLETVRLSKQK